MSWEDIIKIDMKRYAESHFPSLPKEDEKEKEMAERDFQMFMKEKEELLEMLKEVEKKIQRVFFDRNTYSVSGQPFIYVGGDLPNKSDGTYTPTELHHRIKEDIKIIEDSAGYMDFGE